MYPWVRFLKTLVGRLARRGRLGPGDASVLRFRVWPGDLDFNGHLNGGRYLTLMDMGRVDLILRTGLLASMRRHRWLPVIAEARIEYRRELRLFQRYRLTTRILGWDAKWFFIEHVLERGGKLITRALLRTVVRSRDGAVEPSRVLGALGVPQESPPLPEEVLRWSRERGTVTAAAPARTRPSR